MTLKLLRLLILILPLFYYAASYAASESILLPPDDARQSITYWKAHTISALEDDDVQLAEQVFARLLRGWDNSRVEPGLFVVRSEGSAWAASLADGNILLSREAIRNCLDFGRQRGEHLLAFVLAHELAHQRSDDLWHQRFFRSMRNQSKQQRALMLDGTALENGAIDDIEQKELQADHDGLILMSSVGFDPWQVLAGKDFFTSWVENIWQSSCDLAADKGLGDACQEAKARALRTRSQLDAVASQSAVYDLGIQALVTRNYDRARYYFTLYGREYPNRIVMSAIGLSYLSEALSLHQQLIELAEIDQLDFYYPLLLEASAGVPGPTEASLKRSGTGAQSELLQQRLKSNLKQAEQFLEKAIQLDPDHRPSYLSLAIAHLLDQNPYLVRGVLQGRYIPRFGQKSADSTAVSMLLAMTSAQQGDHQTAQRMLNQIVAQPLTGSADNVLPQDILMFSAVSNLAAIYRYSQQTEKIPALWQTLAQKAQASGNSVLFRMALNNLSPQNSTKQLTLSKAPSVKGIRIGDRKSRDDTPHQISELWIEGEQYHVYVYEDGARYISASNGKVVSASQVGGLANIEGLIEIGGAADRPLKTLGLPDRRIHLSKGEYIAYDDYRLALHIDDNRVLGWFLYP